MPPRTAEHFTHRCECEGLLLEMPLRECPARARLQVALEVNGPRLIRELDYDMKLPRSVPSRVRAAAGVVVVQAPTRVGGQADIEAGTGVRVSQNINDVFVCNHARRQSKPGAWPDRRESASFRLRRWVESQFLPRSPDVAASVSDRRRKVRTRSPTKVLRVYRAVARSEEGCPPPPLRGYGAASFAWLAEPKLTLRPLTRVSEGWWTRPGSNR